MTSCTISLLTHCIDQCIMTFCTHTHILQAETVRQQSGHTADRKYKCYRNASLSLNVATLVLGALAAVAIIPIYIHFVYPRMYSWTIFLLCSYFNKNTQQLILLSRSLLNSMHHNTALCMLPLGTVILMHKRIGAANSKSKCFGAFAVFCHTIH